MIEFNKAFEKEVQRIIIKNFKDIDDELDKYRDVIMGFEKTITGILSDIEDLDDRLNDLEHGIDDTVQESDFVSRISSIEERLDSLHNYESEPIEDKPLPTKVEKVIIKKLNEILKQIKV